MSRWHEWRVAAGLFRRRMHAAILATGDRVSCPFCGWSGWSFFSGGRPARANRKCPRCGSVERHRALLRLLARLLHVPARRVLQIAPEKCVADWFQTRPGTRYVSLDLSSESAMVRADLRQTPFADATFELVVCLHVLEHIPDDRAALREIHRVLRPGGLALLMVPLGGAVTDEDFSLGPAERTARYGQSDHVRRYGLDFQDRLAAAGFTVSPTRIIGTFPSAELDRYALRGEDEIFFEARR